MSVVPNLRGKLVGETRPGELIRFPFRGKLLLGMVVGCDFLQIPSGLVILGLEEFPDRPGSAGCFLPIDNYLMEDTALSFGTSHIMVVPPTALAALDGDLHSDSNGALLIRGDQRTIRSRSVLANLNDFSLFIDVENWKALRSAVPPQPAPRQIALLAWELRLMTDVALDPPLPPVFTFRVKV